MSPEPTADEISSAVILCADAAGHEAANQISTPVKVGGY